MDSADAHKAAELAARSSYGRLLAIITARTRDVASAENALAEAFARALEAWPKTGVPDSPEAWLITTARRVAGHEARKATTRSNAAGSLEILYEEMEAREMSEFPDDRLKLLFACAHPAIDPAARTPLMLQCVLGLTADAIARAFLVNSASMGQRLVRAKTRLRDAGIPFRTPDPTDLPDRLEDVLSAIYAAFGTGWDMVDGGEAGAGLTQEALFLGRLVMEMLPAEPEPKGLMALMLYCEARRPARRGTKGEYVPLGDQDRGLWSEELLIEAEMLLSRAAEARRFGRFQTEAAIQSVHMQTVQGEVPERRVGWSRFMIFWRRIIRRSAPWLGARSPTARCMALMRASPFCGRSMKRTWPITNPTGRRACILRGPQAIQWPRRIWKRRLRSPMIRRREPFWWRPADTRALQKFVKGLSSL